MPTNPSYRIKSVEITNDTLTSRGGISLFVKYLQAIDIVRLLLEKFGGLKKIRKGVTLQNFFLQVLCFFMEGTKKWTPKFGPVAKLDFSGSAGHERTAEL